MRQNDYKREMASVPEFMPLIFFCLAYYENDTIQLFKLRNDIGEQNYLSASEPEKAKHLLQMLHDRREKVGAKMMEANPDYQASEYQEKN